MIKSELCTDDKTGFANNRQQWMGHSCGCQYKPVKTYKL